MSKLIFIVRHAQTDMNVDEVYYDNHIDEHDVPINQTGIKQSRLTASYLTQYKPDIIYSSPRLRCVQTSSIIVKKTKCPIVGSSLLLEGKAGKFHGVKQSKIMELSQQDDKFMKLYNKREKLEPIARSLNFYDYNKELDILKVQDGESSLLKLLKGYDKFIKTIIASKHKRICIVGHSGTVSGLISIMCGMERFKSAGKIVDKHGNCTITCILYSRRNPFTKIIGDYKFYLITHPNNEHLQKMY